MSDIEIEISTRNGDELAEEVCNAAEGHEAMIAGVLSTRFASPDKAPRFSDVRVSRSVLHDGDTSLLLGVVLGAMRARAVPLVLLREFRQAMFDAGSYAAALALAEQTVSFE